MFKNSSFTEEISTEQPIKIKVDSYRFNWFDWFCIWYPPGWLILFNRHWQHYHDDPEGWKWLEYLLFLIPGGFYLALLIRWIRLGFRSPCRDGGNFDPNYQKAFRDEVIAPIVKYYFRGELQQLENLPSTGPLIVAMNHAGMSFPWDFICLGYLLSHTRGWTIQTLAGVSLFEHPWVIWWLPAGWSKVLGGIPAGKEEFTAAVAQKTILLYQPEGLRGPSKGWGKRYQLQTFHQSFITLSDRDQIPILPVICLGNEYLHPWTVPLNKIAKKFGLPFLPISPLMFVFILFPSMGVWAMKTNLRYYIQPVYQPSLTELPYSNQSQAETPSRTSAYHLAQELRTKMQIKLVELKNSAMP